MSYYKWLYITVTYYIINIIVMVISDIDLNASAREWVCE